ncbi:MAG: hypothetical protein KJ899_15365, partial [Gammaproteobacteria bacterium]|nr:hypothetical protein [Gammaproteobacteria bacterium]
YTRDALVTDLVETTEYRKREGRGSYKGCGIQLGKYDILTESSATKIYRGSCVVPVSYHAVQA